MPKDKISQYAFTPAANTDIGGINIDEGCAPSGINNAIRTLMTQIRDLQAGVSGDTIPLTAGGTGSGTAASARAALGLAIGTNVLGYVTPGASGNVLQSDGTNWTSVAATSVTLDTITGGPLALAKGGTNATTAAQARANLNAMQNYTAGATGQVLTSTGTGWVSQDASGGQLNAQLFTAPGTWTKPASATQVRVTVIGAGGGGGSWAPAGAISGKAGGSGGFAMAMVPVSAPVTITVGTGGVGGAQAAGGNPGTSGGTSSFGSAVSSTGGGGGGGPTIGTDGTGTVSTGTALRTGIAGSPSPTPAANRALYGLPALGILGGTRLEAGSPAAVAFSTSGLNGAGAGGAGTGSVNGNAGGGIGGGILVEFVG